MNIESALGLRIGDSVQCNDGLIGTVSSTPHITQVREYGSMYNYVEVDIYNSAIGNETVLNVLIENS
jgi:hypothetical protein